MEPGASVLRDTSTIEQSSGSSPFVSAELQQNLEASKTSLNLSSIILDGPQSFDFLCSTCQNSTNLASANFVPNREKLEMFLQSSFEGQMILTSFELEKELKDPIISILTHLLINRELFILSRANKFSAQNLFKKLTIPSNILLGLADKIGTLFGKKAYADIFYTPARTVNGEPIPASGKLLSRLNYMRTFLSENNLLKKVAFTETVESTGSANLAGEDKLNFLATETDPWDIVKKYWTDTSLARRYTAKKHQKGGFSQFVQYKCLSDGRGFELVRIDFSWKFPEQKSVIAREAWSSLQNRCETFIASKSLSGEEPETLLKALPSASGATKDAILLMLFPYAIKAPNAKPEKKRAKKRKIETSEERDSKIFERESFIFQVESIEALDLAINEKGKSVCKSDSVAPVIVVVGPVTFPERFFVLIGNSRYETESVIDALYSALTIFVTYNLPYPKATKPLWLLFQKVFLKISSQNDSSSVQLSKALSFFES